MQAIDKQQSDDGRFDPAHSVFVAANAGSGKTSLLVSRVLSLLMHGVEPQKILCLTFTNGAAAEMSDRITGILGSWVMMDEAALTKQLATFLPSPIRPETLARARSLFAVVLDAPVGVRLQTIHGFCQSLLARFPLEAGVGMHMQVMDDTTQATLLKEARMQLFARAGDADRELLHRMVQQLGEHSLLDMLTEIVKQKRRLSRFVDSHHGLGFATKHLYQLLGTDEGNSFDHTFRNALPRDAAHLAALREAAGILGASKNSVNRKTARILLAWADAPVTEESLTQYIQAFFDVEKEAARKLFTQKTLSPVQEKFLDDEAARVLELAERFLSWRDATYTASLLSVAVRLLGHYDTLKEQHGLMDFDDQILAATRLLTQSHVGAWVMYKLDGGIDHVLVDEAQDTSPEQWQIVRAITDEFFRGQGRKSVERSLFVVGDEKQSIFRFQGADPAGLATNRHYFMQLLADAAMPCSTIALTHSYRSAPEILQLVDQVFAPEAARAGLSADGLAPSHQAMRRHAKGYCELWPLTEADAEKHRSAESVLARQLAAQINEWVVAGASPGDVMVLVRTRKRFPHMLSRELKRLRIPVAGIDRINLQESLVAQDLLAFAQALLLPEDDLTLAALLKSPLFNLSEESLFSISHGRRGSLWEGLATHADGKDAHALLSEFRAKVDFVSPYALFCELLDARGYRRAFTGRMGEETHDVLDIFLEQALLFEQGNIISMQAFLGWMQAGDSEIKRDMEHAGAQVRIMTVHAAKGLQAKIVVLADTTSLPTIKDRLQWRDEGGVYAPLATTSVAEASSLVRAARLHEKELEMEQYHRLLYVALTRAEDMLVVCGAFNSQAKKTGLQDGAWYGVVAEAFSVIGRKLANGRMAVGEAPQFEARTALEMTASAPVLLGMAPEEQEPPRPLSPSQLQHDAPAAAPPTTNAIAAQRGVAMHRMLQYVPAIVREEDRRATALALAKTHAPLLDDAGRAALVAQLFAVMQAPEFAPIFAAGSMPEVPVTGMVAWQGSMIRVVGQVDRLAVTGDTVWVVDYKSAAAPPPPDKLPPAYVQQMALYRAVLQAIYPRHTVRTGLLWTAILRMDVLDECHFTAYI